MIVIPAIDLKNGRVVRLQQGRPEQETVYSFNPVEVAQNFVAAGARMIHLVDLDGAFFGEGRNLESIKAIRARVDIPIQMGGGMRTPSDVEEMIEVGIDSVILGTMAVEEPEMAERVLNRFGPDRIQIGIDAKNGMVSVHGWEKKTRLKATVFGKKWAEKGLTRAIFTDIDTDGMLGGPNMVAIRHFAETTGLGVTASGGISSKEDVRSIKALEQIGVDRIIIGKALYEGSLKLEEVL